MSIWSWIEGFFAPLHTIDHAILGRAIVVSRLASGTYYWETSKEIQFDAFSILVVFDAGSSGPTDTQAQMWPYIKDHFERFFESAKITVLPILKNDYADLALSDLVPRLVELPKVDDPNHCWEMGLEHEKTGSTFLVFFQGDSPVGVEAD